jgi:phosphoglycerate dehydrogenase-like enzyme
MEIHTCLWHEVAAFDFAPDDFSPLQNQFPDHKIVVHETHDQFLSSGHNADYLLTWEFQRDWYKICRNLKAVFTPAAGDDWVVPDPAGKTALVHGTFHGPILAESLLGALLYMNHAMPAMIENFEAREWDRDIQHQCRLLAGQTVMIIGLGHIGSNCARYLEPLCERVIGIKRRPDKLVMPLPGVDVHGADEIDALLAEADHVVTLLPGAAGTDQILDAARLRRCKVGAFIYNFGRGNAIATDDLLAARDHLGGAFLDVVDKEPLPKTSPLWDWDKVMITPHSSCVYEDYRSRFIEEVIESLRERIS